MPLTPADAAALPKLVRDLEAVVAEVKEATDPDSPSGRKVSASELGAILRRLLVVVGDIVAIIVL